MRKFPLPAAPNGWRVETVLGDGARFVRILTRQSVILSESVELDGRTWVHFSTARPDRVPNWDELVEAKELFLGAESKAVQVLAPRSEWVNIHPYCLHLFVCLDADPLPDFTRGSGGL